LSLIFFASGKPPVIPVMTIGASNRCPNSSTVVSISAKSTSGRALCRIWMSFQYR
jgi:hypothetical protein